MIQSAGPDTLAAIHAAIAWAFAIDINLLPPMLGGVVDYTSSSVPALRHWGVMVFGIGVLMVVAAFRPWLRTVAGPALSARLERTCSGVTLFMTPLWHLRNR